VGHLLPARQSAKALIFYVVAIGALLGKCDAHPELLAQIDELTSEIAQQPTSGVLYLRRGEVHRLHQDWDAAMQDYEQAQRQGADVAGVRLARGHMLLEAGRMRESRAQLDALVAEHPEIVPLRITRAQLLDQTSETAAAVDEYTSAIQLSADPRPEWYLARAQLLVQLGRRRGAVHSLDEGIGRLGPIVGLELRASEIEAQDGQTSQAAERLLRLANSSGRKETYMLRIAEIYSAGKDSVMAAKYADEARQAIAKLPERLQKTSATRELLMRLERLHTIP
jgi:tetratricopeptide (TPR) repeat protein